MERLVIDRRYWLRGRGGEASGLLMSRISPYPLPAGDEMCCLGFFCLQQGIARDDLRYRSVPSNVNAFWSEGPFSRSATFRFPWLREHTGNRLRESSDLGGALWEDVLAIINDCKTIDDATREVWLAEGFKTLGGIEVEFVN